MYSVVLRANADCSLQLAISARALYKQGRHKSSVAIAVHMAQAEHRCVLTRRETVEQVIVYMMDLLQGAEVALVHLQFFFFFQAEDGIRDYKVTGVQTCALPISIRSSILENGFFLCRWLYILAKLARR